MGSPRLRGALLPVLRRSTIEQTFALDPRRIRGSFAAADLTWKLEDAERIARGASSGKEERREFVELAGKAAELRANGSG